VAHFAKIDNNGVVEKVIVIPDEHESNGPEYIESLGFPGEWIQTSYNTVAGVHVGGGTPFRSNYAGIGYFYDRNRDAFVPPMPEHGNWVLDESSLVWQLFAEENPGPADPAL